MNIWKWVIAVLVFSLIYFFLIPELSTEVPRIVTSILKILTLGVAGYWLITQLQFESQKKV